MSTDPSPHPDVVVIGSASRDLTRDDPRGWRLGGAVSYAALTLARLGLRVAAVVGADSEVAGARELDDFRVAGVDVRLVPLAASPIFENIETPSGRAQTVVERGEPLPPDALPDDLRAVATWLFAPVADELPEAWADLPPSDALVALGWQGLLRALPRGGRVRPRAPEASWLLKRAEIVGVSRDDLPPGAPPELLMDLLRPGAALVVTEAMAGGARLAMREGAINRERYEAIPTRRNVDPTGAGDVFLATYLAARRGRDADEPDAGDLALASAAASLAVEAPGLEGVPTLVALAKRLEEAGRAPTSDP